MDKSIPLPKASKWVVEPQDYDDVKTRLAYPVVRRDLKPKLLTTSLRLFPLDDSGNALFWKERLDLYTKTHRLGEVLWLHHSFLKSNDFEEILDEIKRRGLYVFDIWGYAPDKNKKQTEEYYVSKKTHNLILKKLGAQFLGWDNGEQDGKYIGSYAPLICPSPSTRRDAFEKFCKFFEKLGRDNRNYLVALSSLTFPHYFAHMGNHILIGAETAQGLPNVSMWYSFIRGAGKQYGVLWFGNVSVFNRWGFKTYDRIREFQEGRSKGCGPCRGTSISLLKRLWHIGAMYGSVIMGFEQGQIMGDDHERVFQEGKFPQKNYYDKNPPLTPIGKLQLECSSFHKNNPELGRQYTPAALILDFYSGWTPPRHLYGDPNYPYKIWGNMPYSKGDHQIDLFFRKVFPGYEDSGFYRDERGFLTTTPYGDIFDVLLTNVSDEVLNQYPVAFVIGETPIKSDLQSKLERYVKNGGKLVVFANQVENDELRFAGWKKSGGTVKSITTEGHEFSLLKIKPFSGKIIAQNEEGLTLAAENSFGRGKVITIASEYGLSTNNTCKDYAENIISGKFPWSWHKTEKPLPSPFEIMEPVWNIISNLLNELLPIKVNGYPVQFIINTTSEPDLFYLLVSNNQAMEATVNLKAKVGRIKEVRNLFTGNAELLTEEGTSWFHVPPLEAIIFEVKTDKPCVKFIDEPQKPVKVCRTSVDYLKNMDLSAKECLRLAAHAGADSAGIRYKKIAGMDSNKLNLLKKESEKCKIRMSSLYLASDQTPYFEPDIGNIIDHREKEVEEFFEKVLETAKKLGVENIIFSCGGRGDLEKRFDKTVENMRFFSMKASEHGINSVIVNHHLRLGNHAEEINRILSLLDNPVVFSGIDAGHAVLSKKRLSVELSILSRNLKYVYLNSPAIGNGPPLDTHFLPDEKMLTEILSFLKNVEFKGFLSLNPEGNRITKKELKEKVGFIKKQISSIPVEICIL